MAIGVTMLIVGIIVVFIWVFIELKRFRHKLWAIFLVALILFSYLGFLASIKGEEINFKTVGGLKIAGNLYLSWLGNIFKNVKIITASAVKMDWDGKNSTIIKPNSKK